MGSVNIPNSLLHINGGQQVGEQREKRAPVTVAIDDLQDAVNRVANSIERVTSKIDPVLRGEPPTDRGVAVAQDASGSSQLALTIDAETRRLHVLAEQLNDVIDRVEL